MGQVHSRVYISYIRYITYCIHQYSCIVMYIWLYVYIDPHHSKSQPTWILMTSAIPPSGHIQTDVRAVRAVRAVQDSRPQGRESQSWNSTPPSCKSYCKFLSGAIALRILSECPWAPWALALAKVSWKPLRCHPNWCHLCQWKGDEQSCPRAVPHPDFWDFCWFGLWNSKFSRRILSGSHGFMQTFPSTNSVQCKFSKRLNNWSNNCTLKMRHQKLMGDPGPSNDLLLQIQHQVLLRTSTSSPVRSCK